MRIELTRRDISKLLIACTTLYRENPENRTEYKRIHDELRRQMMQMEEQNNPA